METIHIAAYALLLETIGMPESEFGAFMEYEAMRDKHDYMQQFGVETDADIARTLAMFGGFTEGLQLFASFAMLMNFPRHNKMKGMGQIVSAGRCATRACTAKASSSCTTPSTRRPARSPSPWPTTSSTAARPWWTWRTSSSTWPSRPATVQGMTPDDIKKYIRFIADWRLRQLHLPELYGGRRENPLPWLQSLLSGVEHANFFEARATEYSKAATQGPWHGDDGVWGEFDTMMAKRAGVEGLLEG